jgi:LysM repeat protein
MQRRWIVVIGLWFLCTTVFAAPLALQPGAPKEYTVQPGDTLIEIANRYLLDPSEWPQLLQNNPRVSNPYRLYPGEILTLSTVGGQPHLNITAGGTIKLSPQIRSYPLNKPIPYIPLSMIKPFLNGALVVNQYELDNAPYIVAHADHHIVTGAGDQVYALGIINPIPGKEYSIFRKGEAFKDPQTKQVLGFYAINVGFAQVKQGGSPSTLLITQTTREVLTGDRLQPSSRAQISQDFIPSIPRRPVVGQLIYVVDGVTQISQYQIVVIDRGETSGLRPGNLLDIYQIGETIDNPIKSLLLQGKIKLPNQHVGQLMVFRTFPQVSYGIVLSATAPIHLLDLVTLPKE